MISDKSTKQIIPWGFPAGAKHTVDMEVPILPGGGGGALVGVEKDINFCDFFLDCDCRKPRLLKGLSGYYTPWSPKGGLSSLEC